MTTPVSSMAFVFVGSFIGSFGAAFLKAGAHRFVHPSGPPRLACLWAPAWNRGYSPFDLKDRDF